MLMNIQLRIHFPFHIKWRLVINRVSIRRWLLRNYEQSSTIIRHWPNHRNNSREKISIQIPSLVNSPSLSLFQIQRRRNDLREWSGDWSGMLSKLVTPFFPNGCTFVSSYLNTEYYWDIWNLGFSWMSMRLLLFNEFPVSNLFRHNEKLFPAEKDTHTRPANSEWWIVLPNYGIPFSLSFYFSCQIFLFGCGCCSLFLFLEKKYGENKSPP